MALPAKYKLSNEAISFQGKSLLFKELTLAFENIIESNNRNVAALNDLKLGAIIKHHTGLDVVMTFDDAANAYAIPPVIDQHSPLVQRWRVAYGPELVQDFMHEQQYLKRVEGKVGSIDLARSRVTGVFTQLPLSMVIGTGLWSRLKLTAEQVAAIVLHELGHLFTFLEFLTRTVTVNAAITTAIQLLNGESRQEERIKIVNATARMSKAALEDANSLADPKVSDKEFAVVMVRACLSEGALPSATGSYAYDTSGSEFVADQFATRHGAGKDLVLALDKLHRGMFDLSYSTPRWLLFAIEAARLGLSLALVIAGASTGMALWSVMFAGTFLLSMIDRSREHREYDLPADRLNRIKRDLVQVLKDPKLPASQRKLVTDDIVSMDILIKHINAHRGIVDALWRSLTSSRRQQYSQMRFQQELEKIINNDIFVKASQLHSLT